MVLCLCGSRRENSSVALACVSRTGRPQFLHCLGVLRLRHRGRVGWLLSLCFLCGRRKVCDGVLIGCFPVSFVSVRRLVVPVFCAPVFSTGRTTFVKVFPILSFSLYIKRIRELLLDYFKFLLTVVGACVHHVQEYHVTCKGSLKQIDIRQGHSFWNWIVIMMSQELLCCLL